MQLLEKNQKKNHRMQNLQDPTPTNAVVNSIGEFYYNPEDGIIFAAYFCRYKNVFRKNVSSESKRKKYVSYFKN